MPLHPWNWKSRDDEKRKLQVHITVLQRALATQKQNNSKKEEVLSEWIQKYHHLEKDYHRLQQEHDRIKQQRDKYKQMLFKPNKPTAEDVENDRHNQAIQAELLPKKKRGAVNGHKGAGRQRPTNIDHHKRVRLTNCPDCHNKLSPTDACYTHTVEDIPPPEQTPLQITQYEIERQWCRHCKKEVTANPYGVIPHSRFGLNLIIFIMILKYGIKATIPSIIFLLKTTYGIHVSAGGIIKLLYRAKQYLGPAYTLIRNQIRASPIKHADETSWRINGINQWLWAFLKQDSVYYTVEESRGKGIPEQFFKDTDETAILVRDNYAGYKNLPMQQQSCWAHNLRESHDAVSQPNASEEMKNLHNMIKDIYAILVAETNKPFVLSVRQYVYDQLLLRINAIINTNYTAADVKHIQTRLANQHTRLITALLHDGVPLTNNLAERTLRPLVVTRKISGGSRSGNGAKTHMTNMSVFQTILMQQQPLIPTLRQHLLDGAFGER